MIEAVCVGWGHDYFPGTVRELLPSGEVQVLWDGDEPSISNVPPQLVRLRGDQTVAAASPDVSTTQPREESSGAVVGATKPVIAAVSSTATPRTYRLDLSPGDDLAAPVANLRRRVEQELKDGRSITLSIHLTRPNGQATSSTDPAKDMAVGGGAVAPAATASAITTRENGLIGMSMGMQTSLQGGITAAIGQPAAGGVPPVPGQPAVAGQTASASSPARQTGAPTMPGILEKGAAPGQPLPGQPGPFGFPVGMGVPGQFQSFPTVAGSGPAANMGLTATGGSMPAMSPHGMVPGMHPTLGGFAMGQQMGGHVGMAPMNMQAFTAAQR